MSCIMVVEDDETVREVLQEALQDAGFRVVAVGTADVAVTLLNLERLRLIITDINLPGRMNGIDLALAANESRPEMPIFVISGRPSMLDEARKVCPTASFFQKPFSFEVLFSELYRLALHACKDHLSSVVGELSTAETIRRTNPHLARDAFATVR